MYDYTELQNDVIDLWENEAVPYCTFENNGFPSPEPTRYESAIKDEYRLILDDPRLCLAELGYSKMSDYIHDRQLPIANDSKHQTVGVSMTYSLISNLRGKFTFTDEGKEIEFYIDRYPSNGTATLWIRPGCTEGGLRLVRSLLSELERARNAK
jgi:hypothetical protein